MFGMLYDKDEQIVEGDAWGILSVLFCDGILLKTSFGIDEMREELLDEGRVSIEIAKEL